MKISIAMASYNGEKYIGKQLDSILNQTVQVDEIVVSDDCSTDNTLVILKKYQETNPNIKIITSETNRGYIKNFYDAVKNTSGDYILLCDQDDVWENDKIQTLIDIMQETGAIAVCSNFELIDQDDNILLNSGYRIKPFIRNCNETLKKITFDRLIWGNIAQGCTYCITKNVKDIYIKLNSNALIHDYQLMFISAMIGDVYFCNKKLIKYRLHGDNAIGVDKKNKIKKFKFRKPLRQPSIVEFLNQLNQILDIPNLKAISVLYYLRLPYLYMKIRG